MNCEWFFVSRRHISIVIYIFVLCTDLWMDAWTGSTKSLRGKRTVSTGNNKIWLCQHLKRYWFERVAFRNCFTALLLCSPVYIWNWLKVKSLMSSYSINLGLITSCSISIQEGTPEQEAADLKYSVQMMKMLTPYGGGAVNFKKIM